MSGRCCGIGDGAELAEAEVDFVDRLAFWKGLER